MNQVLHIFRKDTRRLWLEIGLTMVLAVALVALYPSEWRDLGGPASERVRMTQYAGLLMLLLIVGWWLLIARLVQAEALVGEQQFWITRPYEWKKLLTEKVVFVAVWIGVPYTVAQLYLLHAAGFPSLAYAGGLLADLAPLAVMWLLPLFAMATVTSNLTRLALTVLSFFIVLLGFEYVLYDLPHSGYVATNPYTNAFAIPLLFAGCAAAIGLQYATRRTWVARGLLLAAPVLLAASVVAYRAQALVDRAYPKAGAGTAPVRFRLDKAPTRTRSFAGADYTSFDLKYSGVASGTAVFGDDFKYTVVAADGSQFTSPWQRFEGRYVPGQEEQRAGVTLMMRPEEYERFKQVPVTLRITFALSLYQADAVMNTAFPDRETTVPGIGICKPQGGRRQSLHCRAPLGGPSLTRVTVQWSWTPCDNPQLAGDADTHGDMWLGQGGPAFSLNSVWNSDLGFGGDEGDLVRNQQRIHVCPGSPLTVMHYRPARRTQMEVTFPNIVLPARVDPT